ncbi:hypothetical protein Hamer_G003498 [Homarus americanus]|uniref:Uncharacterized protein n=1 Tax=Homarus americanus TaxID=6706 RepID=A0A8J5MTZ9_HOMAM|nr:hypothetical protein Hamer_G003498 [Homarus americanus]
MEYGHQAKKRKALTNVRSKCASTRHQNQECLKEEKKSAIAAFGQHSPSDRERLTGKEESKVTRARHIMKLNYRDALLRVRRNNQTEEQEQEH